MDHKKQDVKHKKVSRPIRPEMNQHFKDMARGLEKLYVIITPEMLIGDDTPTLLVRCDGSREVCLMPCKDFSVLRANVIALAHCARRGEVVLDVTVSGATPFQMCVQSALDKGGMADEQISVNDARRILALFQTLKASGATSIMGGR